MDMLDDNGRPLWQKRALCRPPHERAEPITEIFYPERGSSTKEPKAICKNCPVKKDCLDYALMNGEKFGIWGGKSERERRKIRRDRAEKDPNWKKKLKEQYGLL